MRPISPLTAQSPLRLRLGELLGATCRYHLRCLFNSVPPSYTTPSKKHPAPDNSNCRSKIHELVQMEAPDGAGRDSAAADGSISSVLNAALKHIHEYFCRKGEFTNNVSEEFHFCSSTVSQRGADKRTVALSDDDLDQLLSDIDVAHTAMVGARAAKVSEGALRKTRILSMNPAKWLHPILKLTQ